ncbi:serine carboxypeptidase-like 51 [Zostera marina]|uniref:Carboxypeptidase n=1 Tax=Zostera marina TaxID=29655 RepID=A0A0K9PSW5_ZOSMR|nr:serine carboxypeptidase-like 51 [Zostera marina]
MFCCVRLSSFLLPLLCLLLALFFSSLGEGKEFGTASSSGSTADGLEEWGYVQVRPKAHLFWWLYRSPQRVVNGETPWPIVLWLQGGPGSSGVGIGNFQEIGPLDLNLKTRNSTWLQKADLLFVDNPVGTGYSYVENTDLFVKTDEEAAIDLTTLLKFIFNENEKLQKSPLYIIAESYGGKYAVTLGLSILDAVQSGHLKLKLGGIALGDSWISPEDFVFSWGPLLADVSRLGRNGVEKSNSLAMKIKEQIKNGNYSGATDTWGELEDVISRGSDGVDFYNFLLSNKEQVVAATTVKKYSNYLNDKSSISLGGLSGLMNGLIRRKLEIIPKNVSWGSQSDGVFHALYSDFMKPRINEVDKLLSKGVNIIVYNGQLDLICATKGTEAWVQKLKWDGLNEFNSLDRRPMYCGGKDTNGITNGITNGFTKSYKNLHFFWILGAGHFVPVDEPCISLKMVGEITQSPANVHMSDHTLVIT